MPNQYLTQRLKGVQTILNGVHQSGASMSSATKGQERDSFINKFLKEVMPPIYRFGTGDATDAAGRRSGQLDIVVEYPFAPSLPDVQGSSRLYLAENAAAVIEVKSDLSNQWSEAVTTANKLAALDRNLNTIMTIGEGPPDKAPLFAVGYTGWKNLATLKTHLQGNPNIMGALVIDSGLYASSLGTEFDGSELALWGLVTDLHQVTTSLGSAFPNIAAYAV